MLPVSQVLRCHTPCARCAVVSAESVSTQEAHCIQACTCTPGHCCVPPEPSTCTCFSRGPTEAAVTHHPQGTDCTGHSILPAAGKRRTPSLHDAPLHRDLTIPPQNKHTPQPSRTCCVLGTTGSGPARQVAARTQKHPGPGTSWHIQKRTCHEDKTILPDMKHRQLVACHAYTKPETDDTQWRQTAQHKTHQAGLLTAKG